MTAQQLKNSILQLAVQGKLVPQDPNDEPASVLLERITKERERLIKGKKIKKPKTTSRSFRRDGHYYESVNGGEATCIDEQIPYDIPDSWEWVRLISLGEIVGGGTPKTDVKNYWNDGDIPWLTPADMKWVKGKYVSSGQRNITSQALQSSSAQLMPPGSVIYSSRAPIGYIAIAENDLCTNQGFKSLVPISTQLSDYLYYALIAATPEIQSRASGTTFKEISGAEFGQTLVPFPPLAEQGNIVNKIESLLPEVKTYNTKYYALSVLNEELRGKLKKSILQHAIQGKLVPQDPNDEPASVLLERIAKERAQMGKKAPKSMSRIERRDRGTFLISPDGSEEDITNEIPFDIPESWEWAQLGSLVELKSGTVQKDSETGILYVKVGDLGLSENEGEIVTSRQRAECAEKDIIPPYSVIFPKRGGAIYTNKKRYILSTKVCVDLNTMAVILPSVLFDYVKLWFDLLDLGKIANGSAIPQINNVDIAPLLIPIPPIKEQIRICSAVSEMIQSMKFNA